MVYAALQSTLLQLSQEVYVDFAVAVRLEPVLVDLNTQPAD
jgi:hypothetical protein